MPHTFLRSLLTVCLVGVISPLPANAWHWYHLANNHTNATSPLYPTKNYTLITINDNIHGTRNVSYWVTDDGLAVIDGDIIYGTVADLLSHKIDGQAPNIGRSLSIFRGGNPWAGATVVYKFDTLATESLIGSIVSNAIANWKATAPYLTFKKLPTGPRGQNGVVMFRAPICGGCNSGVGFFNAPMVVNLQQTCPTSPGFCGVWEATHEIGHVLGLIHEHQRYDREKFVHYSCANLSPACNNGAVMPPGTNCCSNGIPSACCTNAGNFAIDSGLGYDSTGLYDIHSLMQYRADAFAIAGTNTLTSAKKGVIVPTVNPTAITSVDSTRICKIYASQCPRARACAAAHCPTTCVPVPRCTKIGLCDDPRTAPPCCRPVTCDGPREACTADGCDFLK